MKKVMIAASVALVATLASAEPLWVNGMGLLSFKYDGAYPTENGTKQLRVLLDGKSLRVLPAGDFGWKSVEIPVISRGIHCISWDYFTPGLVIVKSAEADESWVSDATFAPLEPASEISDFVRRVCSGKVWIPGQVVGIVNGYTERIEKNPADYKSVLSRAAAKVLTLVDNANLWAIVRRFGYSPDFQFNRLDGSLSTFLAPLSNAVVDKTMAEVLPTLKSALADIRLVPDGWNGSFLASAREYGLSEDVFIDRADVLMVRAALEQVIASLELAASYDMAFDYDVAKNLALEVRDDGPAVVTIERILRDFPQVGACIRRPDLLADAKVDAKAAFGSLLAADAALVARTDAKMHFFEYDPVDAAEQARARAYVRKLLDSIDGTVRFEGADFREYAKGVAVDDLAFDVSLVPLFGGKVLRNLLPPFNGNEPVRTQFPDLTFAGLLPDMTADKANALMKAHGIDVQVGELDPATVGVASTVRSAFAAETEKTGFCLESAELVAALSAVGTPYVQYFPDGVKVELVGKKLVVADNAKAGKLKLARKSTELDLAKCKFTDNMSGLKLTYKQKTGKFTGSFKVYNLEKGKIKSYSVKVTGKMDGTKGQGTATLKKFKLTVPFAIH